MKIGLCVGADRLCDIKKEFFADYIELPMTSITEMSDEEITALAEKSKNSGVGIEVANVLFPGGDIMVVGEDADINKIRAYLEKAIKNASLLGVKIVVFGSGIARYCPDGFPVEKAKEQLISAFQTAADVAKKYGITIAIEPLRQAETNMINSVDEAVLFAKKAGNDIKVIADYYHMMDGGESCDSIIRNKDYIVHAHIASNKDRFCPQKNDGTDYKSFIDALKSIGYQGRISIEGSLQIDNPAYIRNGVEYLRELI